MEGSSTKYGHLPLGRQSYSSSLLSPGQSCPDCSEYLVTLVTRVAERKKRKKRKRSKPSFCISLSSPIIGGQRERCHVGGALYSICNYCHLFTVLSFACRQPFPTNGIAPLPPSRPFLDAYDAKRLSSQPASQPASQLTILSCFHHARTFHNPYRLLLPPLPPTYYTIWSPPVVRVEYA